MAKQKIEKLTLEASKREILGKKVKKMRREGKLPANVYGEDFPSQSLTVDKIAFTKLFRHARETHVIYLMIGSEEVPVLVNHVQLHPLNNSFLHIDFRKVNLKKKIEAQVPVQLIGESDAVSKGGGVLLTLENTVTVEALPDKLPDHIEIDLSALTEVGAEVKVSDLPKSADYEYKDEPEKVIIKITEHKEEELAPQVEAAPEPVVEGEKPAEGEASAEGEAETEKQEGEKTEEQAEENKSEA